MSDVSDIIELIIIGVETGDVTMSKEYIHTYLCNNTECRYIEMRGGIRYAKVSCPKCKNGIMRHIKSERT